MPQISFFNTLNKNKKTFQSIKDKEVLMYSCGPTVYNYAHIGNLRSYVMSDLIRRVLTGNGYKVFQVMNLTDIGHLTTDEDSGDDKMVSALKRENLPLSIESLKTVGHKYFEFFKQDLTDMNIIYPEKFVFATNEIEEQIKLIKKLIGTSFAYQTIDGIYFDTSKISDYGILGGGIADDDHSRIAINTNKKNLEDFALWKFSDGQIGFEAPFGKGFPGWHIECSAMSMKYLGKKFDIHTGGIDHIRVHHNNEIAQGEALTGEIPANFWIHNEHLTINQEKMAKSGENFLSLATLKEKGILPLAYRYWLLTARYSTRIDYSLEAILSCQTAYKKIRTFLSETKNTGIINPQYKEKFLEAINDDLDTPKAISILWEILRDEVIPREDKKSTIIYFDEFLGLNLKNTKKETIIIPQNIKTLNLQRNVAREKKDWLEADKIRNKIRKLGFEIRDYEGGQEFEQIDKTS